MNILRTTVALLVAGGLAACGCSGDGMALVRLVSAAIDRSIGRLPALFIGIELALAAMLAIGTDLF